MRRLAGLSLLAAVALASGGEAAACISSAFSRALIHSAVPDPVPEGAIVAEVILLSTDLAELYSTGARARVVRRIHGAIPGDQILVRPARFTSCSHAFANGTTGILVAMPGEIENGHLVVTPIEAEAANGFRLRRQAGR